MLLNGGIRGARWPAPFCSFRETELLSVMVSWRSLECPLQDAAKRATADEILQHPWMREHGTASSVPLDNIVLRRMRVSVVLVG